MKTQACPASFRVGGEGGRGPYFLKYALLGPYCGHYGPLPRYPPKGLYEPIMMPVQASRSSAKTSTSSFGYAGFLEGRAQTSKDADHRA